MRMHYIKILPGDKVTVESLSSDLQPGRITYRFKQHRKSVQVVCQPVQNLCAKMGSALRKQQKRKAITSGWV